MSQSRSPLRRLLIILELSQIRRLSGIQDVQQKSPGILFGHTRLDCEWGVIWNLGCLNNLGDRIQDQEYRMFRPINNVRAILTWLLRTTVGKLNTLYYSSYVNRNSWSSSQINFKTAGTRSFEGNKGILRRASPAYTLLKPDGYIKVVHYELWATRWQHKFVSQLRF